MRAELSRSARIRRAVGAFFVDNFFQGSSRLAQLHPSSRPDKHGVEVVRDVAYGRRGRREHLLDVYLPRSHKEPRAAILYVHGGGFRILSKDSHWVMGLGYARRGYVVFVVNYRLAPKFPYPAALEDCAEAYAWVVENAGRYGADPSRLILAGESAGANLVTAMTIAAAYERPEPFAKRIFSTGVVPKATLPACGIHQVTDTERFTRRRSIPSYVFDRLQEVEHSYLGGCPEGTSFEMADPVCILEKGEKPARDLPPFFLPCGTRDPLLDDTRRLGTALDNLGVRNEVHIFPGEVHAFHAFVWRSAARKCWTETYRFLDEVIGER